LVTRCLSLLTRFQLAKERVAKYGGVCLHWAGLYVWHRCRASQHRVFSSNYVSWGKHGMLGDYGCKLPLAIERWGNSWPALSPPPASMAVCLLQVSCRLWRGSVVATKATVSKPCHTS